MSFCGLLLVFGISTWLPTIMQAAGYSLGSSLLQTAALWVGAGVGMVARRARRRRVGIKPVVAVAFLAGAASLLLMSARPALGVLFLLMFVSGLGFIGSQVLTNAFIVGHATRRAARPGDRLGAVGRAPRRDRRTAHRRGDPVLRAREWQWNFYLFAVPGVLGALLALRGPGDPVPPAASGGPGPA